MNLILSRKGFDSGSGGCPSPILPDGSIFSLPIPDERSTIRYCDLEWRGRNIGELVERLTKGRVKRRDRAHFDPDLCGDHLSRNSHWKPLLGQVGASQGHLRNHDVGAGDIFLFWGLYRRVDEQLDWIGPPMHMIWGWMQVDEIVLADVVRSDPGWAWASKHPHFSFEPDWTNTLYVGSPRLMLMGKSVPGAGVFECWTPALTLTSLEANKPTIWSLPSWFMRSGKTPLSYHKAEWRWMLDHDRVKLQTVSRGQEFVLKCEQYPESLEWIYSLLACGGSGNR
jgi:hypothetical protein